MAEEVTEFLGKLPRPNKSTWLSLLRPLMSWNPSDRTAGLSNLFGLIKAPERKIVFGQSMYRAKKLETFVRQSDSERSDIVKKMMVNVPHIYSEICSNCGDEAKFVCSDCSEPLCHKCTKN